jgi:predicted nucleotidyltransferase
MTGNEATLRVIDALDALAIPYVLVGSFASNVYGVERATQDADLVIELGPASLADVFRRLRPEIRFDPQMGFETVTMTRRHVGEIAGGLFKIELFQLSDDPHDRERFRRRREIQLGGRGVFVLAVEDVIVTKLRWARSKDREDVRDVLAVQGDDRIDWAYVRSWTDRHGTTALLEEIRRSIPPI